MNNSFTTLHADARHHSDPNPQEGKMSRAWQINIITVDVLSHLVPPVDNDTRRGTETQKVHGIGLGNVRRKEPNEGTCLV